MRIAKKPSMDDVKKVAVAALVSALDDGKEEAKKKPGLTGVRAVATGAVIYTAGKAAFSGRRFINERLRGEDDAPEEDEEEPEADQGEEADEDDEADEEPEPEPEPKSGEERVKASPIARRIAEE